MAKKHNDKKNTKLITHITRGTFWTSLIWTSKNCWS